MRKTPALSLCTLAALAACDGATRLEMPPAEDTRVRVALFNIRELSVEKIDEVDAAGVGVNPQLRAAAEIIARVRPDIVLLDVHMPNLDGFATCTELRRLPGGENTPVLMMTAQDDVEAINALEQDHDFLVQDGVFTPDFVETWVDLKRTNEIDFVRLRPHPGEFSLYFNA